MATIQYGDVLDARLLPIDAQDVVTKVRLVVAGGRAGATPAQETTILPPSEGQQQHVTHVPEPIVYEYEDAAHATYGAQRSFALPEGVDPFLAPTDSNIPDPTVINFSNPGSPSAVRDGDPLTYASYEGQSQATLTYSFTAASPVCVGFLARYGLMGGGGNPDLNRRIYVQQRHFDGVDPVLNSQHRYTLPLTSVLDDVKELYAVTQWDARGAAVNSGEVYARTTSVRFDIQPWLEAHQVRVYHFYPLVLNEALLEEIAKSNVRLPAEKPQRVTVKGYVAPDREHTIVGWPGGDYTATVAQHQYELGRTVIDFEQAGSPVGLDADAIETARFQDARVASAIASAGYSLKMGERQ